VGHYIAAKHGVVGLMRTFAVELGQHSIRVNSVHPTHVCTPLLMNEPTYRLFRPDLENPGPDELVVVSVTAPCEGEERSQVTVRYADRESLPASPNREFRFLVNEDFGCLDVTQFVGIVQPSKAPFHSHTYDEVGYIVEGEGLAHVDGETVPLRAGSCFHLAPGQEHCIENSGSAPMRILGVFHPSGDPASRQYGDNK
jgi:mannose-6-phosphate isomerase-like protein (cupin superfamily)